MVGRRRGSLPAGISFVDQRSNAGPKPKLAAQDAAVAEVTVTTSGKFTGRLLPAWIEAPGHPVLR
jgi:hypothetical protein